MDPNRPAHGLENRPRPRLRQRLADRLYAWRDRVMASDRFQVWAAGFPLTRPLARARAAELFDLCAGFVYSQVVFAAVESGLIAALRAGPKTIPELSSILALPEDATRRLCEATTGLRLTAARGPDRYGLGELGAAMGGNPGVAEMVAHHAQLYADLADPLALLADRARPTRLGAFWAYAKTTQPTAADAAQVAHYSQLMAASQPMITREVLGAYDFRAARHLLDIGGGEGRFALSAAEAAPDLRVTVFDLPAVAARAAARFQDSPFAGRLQAVGGDFFTDPLPRGADLVSLVRVIHDHDDAAALRLLTRAQAILPKTGRLILAEPLAGTESAPRVGSYFTFYLMAMGSGRPRTETELRAMLKTAGFTNIRRHKTRIPLLTSVLTARPDTAP